MENIEIFKTFIEYFVQFSSFWLLVVGALVPVWFVFNMLMSALKTLMNQGRYL